MIINHRLINRTANSIRKTVTYLEFLDCNPFRLVNIVIQYIYIYILLVNNF